MTLFPHNHETSIIAGLASSSPFCSSSRSLLVLLLLPIFIFPSHLLTYVSLIIFHLFCLLPASFSFTFNLVWYLTMRYLNFPHLITLFSPDHLTAIFTVVSWTTNYLLLPNILLSCTCKVGVQLSFFMGDFLRVTRSTDKGHSDVSASAILCAFLHEINQNSKLLVYIKISLSTL